MTFFILPAAHEIELRATPARCDGEQTVVLEHEVKQDPKAVREGIVELEQRYLAWQR